METTPLHYVASLSIACLVLSLVFEAQFLIYVALVILVLGVSWPAFTQFLAKRMQEFSLVLSSVVTALLLTILFFFLLTPLAVIRRLVAKKTFFAHASNRTSYYIDRNHVYGAADFKNPW